MAGALTLTKITLRQQAADHLNEMDRQRDLAGAALEGGDLSHAAAHVANAARAGRQCASALNALAENERSPA